MSYSIAKKILFWAFVSSLLVGYAAAADLIVSPIITVVPSAVKKQDMRPVSLKDFFTQYCTAVGYGIPQVYGQIALRIPGVDRGDKLYGALQKCAYLGFIPNSTITYNWNSPVSPRFIDVLVSKNLKIDPQLNEDNETITRVDLLKVMGMLPNYQMLMNLGSMTQWGRNQNYQSPLITAQGFETLTQIYQTFKSDFWSGDEIGDTVLLQWAMKGMADSVGDIHTEYFPPAEASQFNDQLNGSFEWIGWYLDMSVSGQVIITSVMKDAPADKAWLRPYDRIVKVDNYTIQPTDTLATVIAKIKWPSGSTVKLTIDRQGTTLVIPVIRQKITVSLIDYDTKSSIPVISIHTFGWGIANTWVQILTAHKNEIQNASKIIIDLRDNPGGSLQEVADMLGDFIAKDQPVVVTRSRYEEDTVVSIGRKIIDFSQKKIVILVNGSTASASEIMAGTLKDYLGKNVILVGETTYGKWSVQYLQTFDDSSSFKLTVAHWYTGKTKTAIEGVGIQPDVRVILDPTQLKQGVDNQMQAALNQ